MVHMILFLADIRNERYNRYAFSMRLLQNNMLFLYVPEGRMHSERILIMP